MTCFWTANSTNDMFLDYKFIEDRFASDITPARILLILSIPYEVNTLKLSLPLA